MMGRLLRVGTAALLSAAMFGSVGCKWLKGGEIEESAASSASASAAPAPPPGPATVAQDPVPGASAAPSASPSAVAAEDPPPPPDSAAPVPPPVGKEPTAPVRRESIDACCVALAAYKHSGRPAGVRNKAVRAAGICHGIADTVRSGRSTRAAGLAQVRSLAGGAAPPECY